MQQFSVQATMDKYWKEAEAYKQANPDPPPVKIQNPIESIRFNQSILLKNINDIPNMSNLELKKFLETYFDNIIESVFAGDVAHINLFRDARFLDVFIDIVSSMSDYNINLIIRLNNIAYDYISLSSQKDNDIVNRMIKLASVINRKTTPRLLGLGLSRDLAITLAMARYSSFNLNVNVKRVNFIIITQPKILMTQEMITEIYRILYADYRIWIKVFEYFMFDVIPEYNDENNWVTEEIEEINSIINLSILDILNSEPSKDIRDTLVNYTEDYNILNRGKPIRFSMQKISDDYSRINQVVQQLRFEGIYVP